MRKKKSTSFHSKRCTTTKITNIQFHTHSSAGNRKMVGGVSTGFCLSTKAAETEATAEVSYCCNDTLYDGLNVRKMNH